MCIRQGFCIACLILPCISLWADERSQPPLEPGARQPVRSRIADVQAESQQVETPRRFRRNRGHAGL